MTEPKNVVGPKLIQIRSERGMSQAQFAAKCQLAGWDVSRDIIARIELQIRCVTDIELLRLAHVLRVPVESLLPKRRPK
jgi:transcriptional regulator with XRE-family HTH domain